jgi:hypothetical protein
LNKSHWVRDRHETRKAAGVDSGGGNKRVSRLGLDRVSALPVIGLSGKDGQSHLFAEGAADESAYAMRLPVGGCHGGDKQMHLRRRVSQYVSA